MGKFVIETGHESLKIDLKNVKNLEKFFDSLI